ncbi:hypothetical protein D3C80_997290 [compost metagenome]
MSPPGPRPKKSFTLLTAPPKDSLTPSAKLENFSFRLLPKLDTPSMIFSAVVRAWDFSWFSCSLTEVPGEASLAFAAASLRTASSFSAVALRASRPDVPLLKNVLAFQTEMFSPFIS